MIPYLLLALSIAVIAWLAPASTEGSVKPERRRPGKRLEDQDAFAERRKDDDVGGES